MFGLENQKKKKQAEEFVFELEKDLQNAKKQQGLKSHIEAQIQRIKETLRSGATQEEFDQFGMLLYGYASLLKVFSRFKTK